VCVCVCEVLAQNTLQIFLLHVKVVTFCGLAKTHRFLSGPLNANELQLPSVLAAPITSGQTHAKLFCLLCLNGVDGETNKWQHVECNRTSLNG